MRTNRGKGIELKHIKPFDSTPPVYYISLFLKNFKQLIDVTGSLSRVNLDLSNTNHRGKSKNLSLTTIAYNPLSNCF